MIKTYWRLFRCIVSFLKACMKTQRLIGKQGYCRAAVSRSMQEGAIKILNHADVKYTLRGNPDTLPNRGVIFLSNHVSLFDVPLIFATLPRPIRVIAKKELFQIPIMGKVMTQVECLPIDRGDPRNMATLFETAKAKLDSGLSIWIFVEGMRSRTGELLPFKPGGFRFAKETNATIVPVALLGTQRILPAKTSRLHLNQRAELRLGTPIDTTAYQSYDALKLLMVDVETQIRSMMETP